MRINRRDRARAGSGPMSPQRLATIAWATFRLPGLALLAYLFRYQIFSAIERVFDIARLNRLVMSVGSTPVSRLLCVVAAFAAFMTVVASLRTLTPRLAYDASLIAAATLLLLAWHVAGVRKHHAAFILVLLATNWAPDALWGGVLRTIDRLVAAVPGLGELFFVHRYFRWVRSVWRGTPFIAAAGRVFTAIPGATLAAVYLAMVIPSAVFVPLERVLRMGPDVQVVARGNFNGIALDHSGRYLFVTGHGVPQLLRFDTADWTSAPLKSAVPTGNPQGLAYDPATQEIFVFHKKRQAILVFNGADLTLQRSLPVQNLSPGDSWIALDDATDTLALASEADQQIGVPLLIMSRTTGAVLDERREEAGNILKHPRKSLLYLSFFRRGNRVLAYDLAAGRMTATGSSDHRVGRMAYHEKTDELLVASPMESRILRYDAETLTPTGAFNAMFGVRVFAIDAERNLLLAGSMTTGTVALFDLSDQRWIRSWYVGPWLRSIVLAPDRGLAFVSSNGWLYELLYTRSASSGGS